MKRPRPMPEDFAEIAATGVSMRCLRQHYGVGIWAIERWVKEIGGKPRAKREPILRPVPDDFAAYAALETVTKLCARYGCGTALIARWRRDVGGVKPRPSGRPIAIPADFAERAPRCTASELMEHYGVRDHRTIRKMLASAGVESRRPALVPHLGGMGRARAAPLCVNRNTSRAGMAAEYLRRFGPVFRCAADGRQKPDGTHWNRGGRTILTDAEIIERAERNGWKPDAWREVRAA